MRISNTCIRLLAAACLAAPCAAIAQDYPNKTIRIIVPQNPGGTADTIGRQIAQHFSGAFKQPVVVENRPGGQSMIGTAAVARSAPDGHTLLLGVPSLAIFDLLLKEPEIDALKELSAVAQLVAVPWMIAVSAALPVNNLMEFIAHAKANPGKLNYSALGGNQMMSVEYFARVAGISLVRVNYVGEAKAVPALLTNEVQLTFATPGALASMGQSGKIKVLASSAAHLRNPAMPDVPAAAEAGLQNFDVVGWLGLLAPANTPIAIRRKLAGEVALWTKKPEVIEYARRVGFAAQSSTPEEFAAVLAMDNKRWTEIGRLVGIEKQ